MTRNGLLCVAFAAAALTSLLSIINLTTDTPAEEDGEKSVRVVIDFRVPRSEGTIFTCVSPDFYYVKHFLYNYINEGFDVKVYHADRILLNGKFLPVHWCRVHILNTFDVGTAPWIYSDADTRVNLRQMKSFLPKHRNYDGLLITNGTERRKHEIRTNWFVLPRPYAPRTRKIIRSWASTARDVNLQDQAVLNELYSRCRRGKGLQCWHYTQGPVESMHCGSHSRPRSGCMQNMIHANEKIKKYQKSAN